MANEVIVKSKERLFRGKTLEFLKGLSVRESADFMPSRSRRSIMRNFQDVENFVKRCEKKAAKNKRIKTHLRDLVIVPQLVGMDIWVHNGRSFEPVKVEIEMIGHRLGEFAMTRVRAKHTSVGMGATKGSRAKKK